MDFRREANRANALKSTGPRTEEGKKRSRANAVRHGLAGLVVAMDQDPGEVNEARQRWLDCFDPQDEVGLALADMAFRCKRRVETVAEAEDAAAALRVRALVDGYREEKEREFAEDWRVYRNEPNVGIVRLMGSERGCLGLIGEVEALGEKLEGGTWQESDGLTLMGLEGSRRDELDAELRGAQNLFDGERRMRAERGGELPPGEAARAFERSLEKVAAGIAERIARARRGLEMRVANRRGEASGELALRSAAAKFDPTDEGRLRRRYLLDAQREFLRALKAATEESGRGEIGAEEGESEVVESGPEIVGVSTRRTAPNEARSGCGGREECEGREGAGMPMPEGVGAGARGSGSAGR